jgi:hypothetical protein
MKKRNYGIKMFIFLENLGFPFRFNINDVKNHLGCCYKTAFVIVKDYEKAKIIFQVKNKNPAKRYYKKWIK